MGHVTSIKLTWSLVITKLTSQIWMEKRRPWRLNMFIWVPKHAIWIMKCAINLYNFHEFNFPWQIEWIHHHLYWWHFSLLKLAKEHAQHFKYVLQRLKDDKFYINWTRSTKFARLEMDFLGHVLSQKYMRFNPKNIQVIKGSQSPTTTKKVKSFLG